MIIVLILYQMTQIETDPNWKCFADNKSKVNQKLKFGLGRVENIVRKGENVGYQHFLFSPSAYRSFFSETFNKKSRLYSYKDLIKEAANVKKQIGSYGRNLSCFCNNC